MWPWPDFNDAIQDQINTFLQWAAFLAHAQVEAVNPVTNICMYRNEREMLTGCNGKIISVKENKLAY